MKQLIDIVGSIFLIVLLSPIMILVSLLIVILNGFPVLFIQNRPGLNDKIIFGMGGYGGNVILIDVENSRILVLNSLHYNNKKYKYNHKKLILDPFKKGK